MKQQLRERGRRALARISPGPVDMDAARHPRQRLRSATARINRLEERVLELESEMQETRRLNLRLAELTDVVQELLIPIAQRDEDKLREHLDRYSASL